MGLKEKILDSIEGLSIALMDTAIAIPELNITLDCGNSVFKLPKTEYYFVSHYHKDHYDGLIKLNERLEKKTVLFLPKRLEDANDDFGDFISNVYPKLSNFNTKEVLDSITQDSKTTYETFEHSSHRVPSIGIFITLESKLEKASLVYYGDCNLELFKEKEILFCKKSDIWVAECSFPYETSSLMHKEEWGHSSIFNIKDFMRKNEIKNKVIILVHLRPDGPKGYFNKQGIIKSLEEELKNDKNNEYFYLKSWGKPHKPIKI